MYPLQDPTDAHTGHNSSSLPSSLKCSLPSVFEDDVCNPNFALGIGVVITPRPIFDTASSHLRKQLGEQRTGISAVCSMHIDEDHSAFQKSFA